LQKAFVLVTGQRSDGAIIASTLILATVFTPIRGWLQGIVDRRFRDQLDTERLLDAFIARVGNAEWTPDPARTLRAFLGLATGALEATGGRALVIDRHGTRVIAAIGAATAPAVIVRIEPGGRPLGRIELGPRTRGRPYRSGEIELVTRAGRQLGDAILGIVVPVGSSSPRSLDPSPGAEMHEVEAQTEPSQG
ncbi:MAG TPA: hypothetical protein VET90_01275, partial [Candidatus Binatus sp.]|nr:hypothetical protein [Candidatus Binatus sp.]